MAVAIRDLKNRLSAYLRRVRAGERVLVTDRGRPIAELSPLDRRMNVQDRIGRLVESGDVTPPKGAGLRRFDPLRIRGRPLSKTILDDRD